MFKTNLSNLGKRGVCALLITVIATISVAVPILGAPTVQAQSVPSDGKWLDAFNIKVGDFIFKVDPITAAVEPEVPDYVVDAGLAEKPVVLDPGVTNIRTKVPGLAYVKGVASCRDILYISERGASSGQYQEREKSASGDCTNDGEAKKINLSDTGNSKIFAYRQDDDNIFAPLGWTTAGGGECREFKNPVMYRRLPANDPQAPNFDRNQYFLVGNDGNLDTSDYIRTKNDNGDAFIYAKPSNFKSCDSLDILLANNGKVATPPAEAYPNFNPETGAYDDSGANEGGDADDGQDVCISSGFNLSWILCPIFNGVAEATDWIYRTLIDPFLYTPPVSTDPNTESFKVWSSFRVIGNIVLVIGMLVIVFGQSLGGGLIDAYTAKKILPRIIVAAILINLSVYFVAIAVDVSNILGKGIQQLMFAPFVASDMAKFEISGIQGVVGAAPLAVMGAMLGGLVAGGAAAGGGLIGGLAAIGAFWPVIGLTIILPAVLALLAVFVTLILRRALILFLVMVSPIAFAMYCLPNTEKYFKKWWEYFSKALLVYPIIAVMFALADIMAITLLAANGSNNSNGVENGLAFIMAFVIQLIPIFIIPFAFKIAGGAIGSLYGTISGLGKKGTELAKGDPRDPLSARNQAKFKARSALNDTNMSGAAMRTRINPFLRGANRRARLSSIRDTNQAMLGTDVAQAALVKNASSDDKVMTDLGFFATSKASRDAIDAETLIAMDEAKRNHDITNPASTIAYEQRLKDIDATRRQKLAASATADRIGRTSSNRRMAMMQDSTIGYGLKGGEEGWNQAMDVFRELSNGDESQFRSMVNEFQYHAKSSAGRADLSGNVDSGEYDLDRATGSQNLYTLLNSKGSSVKALISQHKARLADPTATDDQKHKSAQFLNEMLGASTKSQGSGAVRDIINDAQADSVAADGTPIYGTQKALEEHVRQQAAQRVQANPNDAAAWDQEFEAHRAGIMAQIKHDSREYTPIDQNTQGT